MSDHIKRLMSESVEAAARDYDRRVMAEQTINAENWPIVFECNGVSVRINIDGSITGDPEALLRSCYAEGVAGHVSSIVAVARMMCRAIKACPSIQA